MGDQIVVSNENDLRANAVVILRRINSSDRGGLLFLLNPVFALEEAGVVLGPAMKRHIRMGLRYGAEDKKRIKQLEAEIGEVAGRPINPASDAEISELLFNRLALKKPSGIAKKSLPDKKLSSGIYEPIDCAPLAAPQEVAAVKPKSRATSGTAGARMEPVSTELSVALDSEALKAMKGLHLVVDKIAEVRTLYQKGWQFMNREHYDRVRQGASVSLVRSVRFKTKTDTPEKSVAKVRPKPSTKIGAKLRTSAFMKRAAGRLVETQRKLK